MPGKEKYPPFTEQEKKQILNRHRELIAEMNKTLPDEMKLQEDPDLPKKLDDPKNVALYRIGQEIQEKRQKQAQIQTDLENRFGRNQRRDNPLTRSLVYALDTRDNDQAKAYNEQLYRDYLNNPEKVVYLRYKKMLDFNPQEVYDLGDDPVKLAEYYRDTYPLCDEAFVFHFVMDTCDVTPAMKSALHSMKKPLEVLKDPSNMVRASSHIDNFACPKLTPEQVAMVMTNRDLMANCSDQLRTKINSYLGENALEDPHEYYEKMLEHNVQLKKGVLYENRPVERKIGPNGRATYEEISYDKLFNPQGSTVLLEKRSEHDIFGVKCVTKAFQREYQARWQQLFNQKRNHIGDFDLHQIEDQHKGGFAERYIFFSTSQQYRDMLQALKDFHNPDSPHYLDSQHLDQASQAYLDHKREQGYDFDHLKGTTKARVNLALSIRATIKQGVDMDKLEKDYLHDYDVALSKENALSASDVEEKPLSSEPKAENDLEKNLETQVDIDPTI